VRPRRDQATPWRSDLAFSYETIAYGAPPSGALISPRPDRLSARTPRIVFEQPDAIRSANDDDEAGRLS
jgi:hypothetical protein